MLSRGDTPTVTPAARPRPAPPPPGRGAAPRARAGVREDDDGQGDPPPHGPDGRQHPVQHLPGGLGPPRRDRGAAQGARDARRRRREGGGAPAPGPPPGQAADHADAVSLEPGRGVPRAGASRAERGVPQGTVRERVQGHGPIPRAAARAGTGALRDPPGVRGLVHRATREEAAAPRTVPQGGGVPPQNRGGDPRSDPAVREATPPREAAARPDGPAHPEGQPGGPATDRGPRGEARDEEDAPAEARPDRPEKGVRPGEAAARGDPAREPGDPRGRVPADPGARIGDGNDPREGGSGPRGPGT